LGYLLNLFWFNSLFMLISKNNMNTCTCLIHTLPLIYIMKLLVIFGIKIYQKLPRILTVATCRCSEISFACSMASALLQLCACVRYGLQLTAYVRSPESKAAGVTHTCVSGDVGISNRTKSMHVEYVIILEHL
jgi:hypothetical protein